MSYAYVATFTGNIIAFISGTALTWTSPEIPLLKNATTTTLRQIPTEDDLSWVSSLLPLGASIGPFLFGYAADKFGRKHTLLSLGVPFLVCYLMLAFGGDISLLYAARFVIGLAVGGVFTVIPMYIGEIAEDTNRGSLGASMNCFVCLGILFTYAVGPYVSIKTFNIILAVFPAIYLVLFFFLAPESVHYYVTKEEHDLAKESLLKLRSGTDEEIEQELTDIKTKIKSEGHGGFTDIFKSKGLIKALVISLGLLSFQQFTGVNAVLFYAENIFLAAGTSIPAAVCSIIIGLVQFGISFVIPMVANKFNRKLLLVTSAIGMAVSETVLGIYSYLKDLGTDVSAVSYLPIVSLIIFIITYVWGFGPLPWVMLGELFPSNVKSIASATSASGCWLLAFFITKYFESVSETIGMGPSFWIFAGCCAIAGLFSMFYVIETKGRSLREIQNKLNR